MIKKIRTETGSGFDRALSSKFVNYVNKLIKSAEKSKS